MARGAAPDVPSSVLEACHTAVRAERRRIAQVLHDSASQSLTAVYLQAAALARNLQKADADPAVDVDRLATMLHGVVEELRAVTQQLSSDEELPPAAGSGDSPGDRPRP